jgi:hypothetical protein
MIFNDLYMEKLKEQIRNYQLQPARYMEYEQDFYNSYQNYLYKRALYGLSALTEDELATMCSKKKQRIVNVYKRAQDVLNIAKQKATIYYTNLLFQTLFPESPMTQAILECDETDVKFKNSLTFKDLNLSKTQIISIFIAEGILPRNFLSLEEPTQLPRLRNAGQKKDL